MLPLFSVCLSPCSDGMCSGPQFSCPWSCCQTTPLPSLRCGGLMARLAPTCSPMWRTGLALTAWRAAPCSPTPAKRIHSSSTRLWPSEQPQNILLQGFVCALGSTETPLLSQDHLHGFKLKEDKKAFRKANVGNRTIPLG